MPSPQNFILNAKRFLFFRRVVQVSHVGIDLGKLTFSGGVNEVFTLCELSVLALFLFM